MFKSLSKLIPKNKLNLKAFVQNKYLLYILCLVALLSVIGCACKKDYNSLFTILLIGFITSFFTKNMVIILGVSIALTYILKPNMISQYMEGMEDKGAADKDDEEDEVVEDKDEDDVEEEDTSDEDKALLKENLEEFEGIQNRIIEGLEKMEPLIKRAETFVEKFDKDSKNLEKIKTKTLKK